MDCFSYPTPPLQPINKSSSKSWFYEKLSSTWSLFLQAFTTYENTDNIRRRVFDRMFPQLLQHWKDLLPTGLSSIVFVVVITYPKNLLTKKLDRVGPID